MAVNPSSVIPTWVNNYWPAFYTALTNQEDYSINAFGSDAIAQFTLLASQLQAYKNNNHSGNVSTLTSSIYSYKALQENFGLGSIDLSTFIYSNYFSFGTFGAATLGRSNNYYSDFFMGNSPRLASAINYLQNDALDDEEEKIILDIKPLTQSFQVSISQFLYVDPPVSSTPIGKTGLGEYIFNTLLYKKVYQNLTVTPLTLPPYIT